MSPRERVYIRSDRHCEAMVRVNGVYTRCGLYAEDIHHMLTVSRGGDVLDAADETYHLLNMCHVHHMWVHRNIAKAERAGLYMLGMVWLEGDRVVYSGPDRYLLERYGKRAYAVR